MARAVGGVRVRASAGAASFRSAKGLKKCLRAAKEQVREAKAMLNKDARANSDKSKQAAMRAAQDREARVMKAMEELEKLKASKTEAEAEHARVSTTDPESRVMRMADGGYRPAFNVQLAVDTDARAIVGVSVTNSGTDMGQITPMVAEVERRTGQKSEEWLVDGGYTSLQDIQAAGEQGVKVLAPVPQPKSAGVDPHQPKINDKEHVGAWRKRMGTKAAKETYKLRPATVECTNADLRTHRGMQHLPVRGLEKTLMIGLWMAITYNALLWVGAGAAGL